MAVLNGWLTELYGGDRVNNLLENLRKDHGVLISRNCMNGIVSCSFFLNRNHYGISFEKTLAVIQEIVNGKEEIDAHGLLYIQDDESKQHYDEFQVYVIKKGKIDKKVDTFLSPCSQKIWNYED